VLFALDARCELGESVNRPLSGGRDSLVFANFETKPEIVLRFLGRANAFAQMPAKMMPSPQWCIPSLNIDLFSAVQLSLAGDVSS
jgi:hypothetical protein